MKQRILARLLHWANSSPPGIHRAEFYALKTRLLERFARRAGTELQEIKKDCWGPLDRHGYGDFKGCMGKHCPKCGGTGVFDIRWVQLLRYEWRGFVFHCPAGDTRVPPTVGTVKIFGVIEHRSYGKLASEARLWLYLLCGEWRLLWGDLRSHCYCSPGAWPLLRVQKVAMRAGMYFNWRKCWCGRRFWTRGTGWQICPSCRKRPAHVEIPF